ncbi:dopamine D2-like receptor [Exaiptasia diaphana]|uniref:G-protein coupled receptors family 1 profile domain-containing protein n=1 Tax=Exaiptasia diaphana TaxID=2652724 RepID=A0A913WPT8_EXADI|nr:dopamine D2-like receptor [Exaiptasia diaphana]
MSNNSSITSGPPYMPQFSKSFSIPSFIFLFFIFVMTLSGNILVILAFKSYRKLRTKTNYFVVSLAIADILVAFLSMPIWGAYLLIGPYWNQELLTKFWTWVDILCGVASIINLASISIERCICITRPLTYHSFMTSRRAIYIILANWAWALIISSIKLFYYEWPRPNYELLITISCFFLPLGIMCFSYRLIFKAARYQARQIALVVKGNVKNFLLSTEVRAAKTLGVVMGTFIISWGPFFIMNLVHGFCKDKSCVSHEAIMVAKWMHYSNSFYNPIVYACMNREFRSAFANILFRGKACRDSSNGSTSSRRGTLTELNYTLNNHKNHSEDGL